MTQLFCPACQNFQPAGSKYCRTCGKEIDNQSKTNDPANELPTLPLEHNDSSNVTQPIRQIKGRHPQKFHWKIPLAFLVICVITSVLILTLISFNTREPSPSFKEKELELTQIVYQVDEHVHKPFDKWLETSPANASNCAVGSKIATLAVTLAKQIDAFDTEELRSYRATMAMEKEEYIAMSYSFAAGATDICKESIPEGEKLTVSYAREALTRYETVGNMRQDLFRQNKQEQDSPRLRKVAQDIENITTWYAARAACILYLNGQYDFMKAYRLAQLARDLIPDESDPWMDRVLKTAASSK